MKLSLRMQPIDVRLYSRSCFPVSDLSISFLLYYVVSGTSYLARRLHVAHAIDSGTSWQLSDTPRQVRVDPAGSFHPTSCIRMTYQPHIRLATQLSRTDPETSEQCPQD